MEEWPFVDDRELVSFRGGSGCSTCHPTLDTQRWDSAKFLVLATSSAAFFRQVHSSYGDAKGGHTSKQ